MAFVQPYRYCPFEHEVPAFRISIGVPIPVATCVRDALACDVFLKSLIPRHWSRGSFFESQVRMVRAHARVLLSFGHDPYGTHSLAEGVGRFHDVSNEWLEATFHSFLGATAVFLEEAALLDARAWASLTSALPKYHKMVHLGVHADLPPDELARVLRAAAVAPTLKHLELNVAWDHREVVGAMEKAGGWPAFRDLEFFRLEALSAGALLSTQSWLPGMPALRALEWTNVDHVDVNDLYEGLKRGVRVALDVHGIKHLSWCQANAAGLGALPSSKRQAWFLVHPHRPCGLKLQRNDYAYAQSWSSKHQKDAVPFLRVSPERFSTAAPWYNLELRDGFGCSRIKAGVFAALRHRRWTRYTLLHAMLHASAGSARWSHRVERRGAKVYTLASLLRRVAFLPRELWKEILEWHLGGRLCLGYETQALGKRARKRQRA